MTYLARKGSEVVLSLSVPSTAAHRVVRHRVWRVFDGMHVAACVLVATMRLQVGRQVFVLCHKFYWGIDATFVFIFVRFQSAMTAAPSCVNVMGSRRAKY